MFWVSYVFPPPTLVPLVLSKFLAEHVKGQIRLLILVAPCWMEAPWLNTVLSMLADVPWWCPIMKVNPLAAQRCVLCRQGLSSSVFHAVAGATEASTSKLYQPCWKEWAGWCGQEGVPNNAISAPKLAVLAHLFRIGLAWCTIGICHSAIFLEPHHLHKASNHPVTSKLMCYFYLQHTSSCKHFDPWNVEGLLSLLESRALASSPSTFKLAWNTATLLALVTMKHCSELTLLCIDNQHLFVQLHAAIFIPISGARQINRLFLCRFMLSLIPILIFALIFM